MAETISPVVYGGRTRRYWNVVLLHTAAAGAAAALVGGVLAGLGEIAHLAPAAPYLVAGVALVYFVREALGVPIPIPAGRRQVPEWWRTFFPAPTTAILYGAGLGAGFATPLTYGTLVAVAAGALASGNPAIGALLLAPFGIARGLSPAIASLPRLEALDRARIPGLVNGLVLALVTGAALLLSV